MACVCHRWRRGRIWPFLKRRGRDPLLGRCVDQTSRSRSGDSSTEQRRISCLKNKDTGSTFWQDFDFVITGAISGSARPEYGSRFIFLANLPARDNVSAGSFSSVAGHPNIGVLISNWSDGQFSPVGGIGRGFVGFRFNTGNGMQYGWARISTKDFIINGRHHIRDNIKDYAWGDVGDVILTGQKSSSGDMVDAVTDSGSIGLLALGAAGLIAWRKRRGQATQ